LEELAGLRPAITAVSFATAPPVTVAVAASGTQIHAAPSGTTASSAKGWIKLTHNAGTPQKPVNKPIYINVSQICMVSDAKNEAPRRYGTYILLAGGSVYVLESVDEVVSAINGSNSGTP
jgi:hypothetical protein